MRYAAVIRQGDRNWSAWIPDLPGCITTGATLEEIKTNLKEAISLHLHGMREDGDAFPAPLTTVEFIEVSETDLDEGIRDVTPAEADAYLRELGIDLPLTERDAA